MARRTSRITTDPKVHRGQPCVRGSKIRVADVIELLAAGRTPQQIVAQYPELEVDDVAACTEYVRSRLSHHLGAAPRRRQK